METIVPHDVIPHQFARRRLQRQSGGDRQCVRHLRRVGARAERDNAPWRPLGPNLDPSQQRSIEVVRQLRTNLLVIRVREEIGQKVIRFGPLLRSASTDT